MSTTVLPILSSVALDTYDRCERRYAQECRWEPLTLSPLALCYRCMESALVSDDPDPEEIAKSLAIRLVGKYEIPVTALDSYTVALHHGWLAGIIAVALRSRLGKLTRPDPQETDDYEWRPQTFADIDGNRHRIVLCSTWDEDRLASEAHSWNTIGELAATGLPLTIHAIIIGAHRHGRRHSAWTKGFLHPVNKSLRFGRRKGLANYGWNGGKHSGFTEGWTEVWRENKPELSTAAWLNTMIQDGMMKELIISREVRLDEGDARLQAARREMVELMGRMQDATPEEPMRRSSCDEVGRGPCPFQIVCYAKTPVTPADFPHLFRFKDQPT